MEIKIKIPNIKNIFNAGLIKIKYFYYFIQYKITQKIDKIKIEKRKKYQVLFLNLIKDQSLSSLIIKSNIIDDIFNVKVIDDKNNLIILNYNKITKKITLYEDNYIRKILLDYGIMTDINTGIITVKKPELLQIGKLNSFHYDFKKLTLYYGNYEHTFVLSLSYDTMSMLIKYLTKLVAK